MSQHDEAPRGHQLSSKISNVLIELHKYSFFHSPTSTHQVDPRFLGRKALRKKLKGLLENTETKSGSYLITGYKGMGKSSFVNKVLHEIGIQDTQTRFSKPTARLLIGLFFFALVKIPESLHYLLTQLLSFLGKLIPDYILTLIPSNLLSLSANTVGWAIPLSLLVLLLIYLTNTSRSRHDIEQKEIRQKRWWFLKWPWFYLWPSSYFFKDFSLVFRRSFRFVEGDQPVARTRIWAKLLYHLLLIHLAAVGFGWLSSSSSFADKLEAYILVLIFLTILNSFDRYLQDRELSWRYVFQTVIHFPKYLREHPKKWEIPFDLLKGLLRFVGKYGDSLYQKFTCYATSLRRICIRINLGYDDLKEVDVLRLVARSIYLKYAALRWDFFPAGLLRFLTLFLLASLFYYLPPIHQANQNIKTSALAEFFPSQGFDLIPIDSIASAPTSIGIEMDTLSLDTLKFTSLETYLDTLRTLAGDSTGAYFPRIYPDTASVTRSDSTLLAKVYRGARRTAIHLDWYVFRTYRSVLNNTPFLRYMQGWPEKPETFLSVPDRDSSFSLVPIVLDYLFLVYLLTIYFLIRFISRRRLFGIVTHSFIRRQLRTLNEVLNSQVIQERTASLGDNISGSSSVSLSPWVFPSWGFSLGRRRTRRRPIADEREIEKNLLEILDLIDRIPLILLRPEFIFVFDELDKVEPYLNYNIVEKQREFLSEADSETFFSVDATRGRQQRILKILSNLKHFLNTAKAKFIFIAGREMYDASLADVSDRNYFIGSIFHDVLYVESFLKDDSDDKRADLTSLTEAYVCTFIMPRSYHHRYGRSLHTYNEYLKKRYQETLSIQNLKEGENLVQITYKHLKKLDNIFDEKESSPLNGLTIWKQKYEEDLASKEIILENPDNKKDPFKDLKENIKTFIDQFRDLPQWYQDTLEEISASLNLASSQSPHNPEERLNQVEKLSKHVDQLLTKFEQVWDGSLPRSAFRQKLTTRIAYLKSRLHAAANSGYHVNRAFYDYLIEAISQAIVQIDRDEGVRARFAPGVHEGKVITPLKAWIPKKNGDNLTKLKATILKEEQQIEHARRLRQRREKVISILKRFVIYLTYRSNGAPKKLTQFFEDFVVEKDLPALVQNEDYKLVIGKSSHNLYLEFSEADQYMLGLLNYLVAPFMLVTNRAIKDYGDKLLVSMSFVLDHLFKYHGTGFSWRNLELMPEIIDINKAPQLRELIRIIIQFLSNTHIDLIVSGLYDFRFSKKIVEEIAFISKISELQSAAFNFTLDESLTSKRHYSKQIQIYEAKYQHIRREDAAHYIHALGFFYMTLGDLHYADEEYDDAIIAYDEALQFLRWIENATLETQVNYAQFLTYIRNMLKLGLVYERKKTYDSAFTAYGSVALLTTQYAELMNPSEASITNAEKDEQPESESQRKLKNYLRTSMLEGIRLMYQALIAQLEVNEKANLGGITITDIERIKEQFGLLVKDLKEKNERYLIASEFYDKVGDILFYKNGLITDHVPKAASPPETASPPGEQQSDEPRPKPIYCWRTTSLCSSNQHVQEILDKGLKTPCSACAFYMRSLEELCTGFLDIEEKELHNENKKNHFILKAMEGVARVYHADKKTDKTYTAMVAMANTLSDVGDTFVSCASREEKIEGDFWEMWFESTGPEGSEHKLNKLKNLVEKRWQLEEEQSKLETNEKSRTLPLSKIEEALLCYYASALYFVRAGESQQYGYQLIKILYVIRDYIAVHGRSAFEKHMQERAPSSPAQPGDEPKVALDSKTFVKQLKENLVIKALRGMYRAFSNAHRLEIASYRHIFVSDDEPEFDAKHVDLNSVSQVVDIRELMIAYYEIEMKLDQQENFPISKKSISTYAGISSVYNRIIELRYKSNLCNKILEDYYLDSTRKIWEYYEEDHFGKALMAICQGEESGSLPNKDKRAQLDDLIEVCYYLEMIFKRRRVKHGRRGLQEGPKLSKRESDREGRYFDWVMANRYKDGKNLFSKELTRFFADVRCSIRQEMTQWLTSQPGPEETARWFNPAATIWELYDLEEWRDTQKGNQESPPTEREEEVERLYTKAHTLIKDLLGGVQLPLSPKTHFKPYFIESIDTILECAGETAKKEIQNGTGPDRAFLLEFWQEKEERIDVNAMMEYLITDAIYCLHKLIDYFQTYGVSYMNTHSLLASTYAKLATWSARFQTYKSYYRDLDRKKTSAFKVTGNPDRSIEGILSNLIAEDERQTLRYSYNQEMALQHYRYAKELHNEGKAYRSLLDNMFYLNDDYNDDHYHFSASMERYWLNTNVIDERIDKVKKITKKSSLYDLDNYDR